MKSSPGSSRSSSSMPASRAGVAEDPAPPLPGRRRRRRRAWQPHSPRRRRRARSLAGLLGELRQAPLRTAPAAGPAPRTRRLAAPAAGEPGGARARSPPTGSRSTTCSRGAATAAATSSRRRRSSTTSPPTSGAPSPAPATYYRRFGLLRRFLRWLSRRSGLPDPFLELEAPPKPQQEADWLTERGVRAGCSPRPSTRLGGAPASPSATGSSCSRSSRPGLRRSELIALDWCDLELESARPSLLVRCGKGGKPRRQPLAPPLAARARRSSAPSGSAAPTAPGLLRPRGQAAAADDPRRDHPPRRRAGRARRSASPRTRSATPPRPGCASRPAMPVSSPRTSATPTSPPSAATPTSPRTSCTTRRRRSRPAQRSLAHSGVSSGV